MLNSLPTRKSLFTKKYTTFSIRLFSTFFFTFLVGGSWGQVTIVSDGFNNTSTLFTLSGGAYYNGSTTSSDGPSSTPYYIEGTHSRGIANGTATLTSTDINTSAYSSIQMVFRVASFSVSSTGNGADGTDYVKVEVSPDGGINYYNTIQIKGNSNAYWAWSSGTGNASTPYDGNSTSVDFNPTGGGARTTDGYSTLTITSLPSSSNLRIKITLFNDHNNERWLIDDFKITGTSTSVLPEPTNQASGLSKGAITTTTLPLTWTAATVGSQAPDGYLMLLNTGSITDPIDGTDPGAGSLAISAGAASYKSTSGTSATFTSAAAGTMYNVKMYSYTNSATNINFNTTSPTTGNFATLPTAATAITSTVSGTSQITFGWTAPAGYNSSTHSTLVFVKSGSAITSGTPTNAPSSYTANTAFTSGTGFQLDASAYCVYNGDGTSVTVTGLSANTTYYVAVYAVMEASNSDNTNSYSSVLTGSASTSKIEPTNQASGLSKGAITTTTLPLTWTAATAGSQAPDGYLMLLNTGSITDPIDGTDPGAGSLAISAGAASYKSTSGTSATFTSAAAGTMYNVKMYSYTNSGTNINFNTTSPTTGNFATLPTAATAITSTVSGTSQITFGWTAPAGYNSSTHSTLVFVKSGSAITSGTPTNAPSSYTANTAFTSGTGFQLDASAYCVYNGDGTSVTVTGLSANTTYYVAVYAVMEASNSDNTNSYSSVLTGSASTSKIEPTNQASGLSKGAITTTTLPLTWTAATVGSQAPDGYLMLLNTGSITDPIDGTDPGAGSLAISAGAASYKSTSGTSATFTSAAAGTMYNVKMYSYTNSGTNINFNTTSPTTGNFATLPTAATAITSTVSGTSQITFGWTAPAGYNSSTHSTLVFVKSGSAITSGTPTNAPSSYTANTAFTSGTGFQLDASAYCVYNGDGTSVTVTGLSANTTYYVAVYAVMEASNSDNTNSYSSVLTGSALTNNFSAPVLDAATNNSCSGFTANWQLVSGASSYQLDVSLTNFPQATDLFISEYIEGSSNNKYIEIYNGTGSSIDLSNYQLLLFINGSSSVSNTTTLSGTLQNGSVIVYKNSSATIYTGTTTSNSSVNYNGDDAVALFKISSSSYVDIIGSIGEDPGTGWTSSSYSTVDKTLVRKSSITSGVSVNPNSGFPTLSTEWDLYSIDVISNLGSHSCVANNNSNLQGYSNLSVSGTSQAVTGLTPNTTYYYRVRATSASSTSGNSSTGSVTTAPLPSSPTASAQSFCSSTAPTISNLTATGTSIQWYANSTGGSALASNASLTSATYYASQTLNGCESSRTGAVVTLNNDGTWKGSSTGNWNDGANWCGGLPSSSSDVTIGSGNTVTLNSSPETVSSMTIAGTLIVPSNNQLTVTGTLTNNGTLTLENGATLLQTGSTANAGSGTYNVKQVISGSGGATPNGRGWYMGSPVSGASSSVFNPSTNGNKVFHWNANQASPNWSQHTSGATMDVGKGYAVRIGETSSTITFSSTTLNNAPSSSEINVPCYKQTSTTYQGYNLVCNPFPSYLDWNDVWAGSNATNFESTIYYRVANGSNVMVFDTYNALNGQGTANTSGLGSNSNGSFATCYIPPMQAFWVKVANSVSASSNAVNLSLTNSMRDHYTSVGSGWTAGLKSTAQDFPMFLRLNIEQVSFKDQMLVFLKQQASSQYDAYDSEKMFLSGYPQVYTKVGTRKLVFNGLNSNKKITVIPVIVDIPTSGVFTFRADEFNVEDGLILLEDKQEGITQDLTINDVYTFYANAGTISNRFFIRFHQLDPSITAQGPSNSWVQDENEINEGGSIAVATNGRGKVTIQQDIDPLASEESHVVIRDAAGREVLRDKLSGIESIFQLDVPSGVYFVEVQLNGQVEVKKIFVQQ